jgi:hypothetical protein
MGISFYRAQLVTGGGTARALVAMLGAFSFIWIFLDFTSV